MKKKIAFILALSILTHTTHAIKNFSAETTITETDVILTNVGIFPTSFLTSMVDTKDRILTTHNSEYNHLTTYGFETETKTISCSPVSTFINTGVSATTASFGWSSDFSDPSDTFEIKYGLPGFNPNTTGTLISNVNSGVTISGLNPNTDYDFYIRKNCSGENSSWSSPVVSIRTNESSEIYGKIGSKYYSGSYRPMRGKEYLISAWVKEVNTDGSQSHSYSNGIIEIYLGKVEREELGITGHDLVGVFQPSGKIIDGWQRIEGTFILSSSMDDFMSKNAIQIQLKNISSEDNPVDVYFDDVRVFPFHGNIKSFVYDDITKKLMAELDENNYATFYEYDNEGGLIRVKKETEKGIYTIQETRSSNAKN